MSETTTKYYAMSKNAGGELFFRMDNITCYPAKDWTEAREGVLTNPVIVETWTGEREGTFARVKGTLVETEEFELTEPWVLDIDDVVVLEKNTLLRLPVVEEGKRTYYEYRAKLKDGTVVSVETSFWNLHPGDQGKRADVFWQMLTYIRENHSITNRQRALEVCINAFTKEKLDSAKYVKVFYNSVFYVFYPGVYRNFYSSFCVKEDGTMKKVPFGNLLEECSKGGWKMHYKEILEEMAKHGISAGEDSGDAVEGVTEEERKLFTTLRLGDNKVLVQFKAETFRYEFLEQEHLVSKVDKGIGKWLYRIGEINDYYTWFD